MTRASVVPKVESGIASYDGYQSHDLQSPIRTKSRENALLPTDRLLFAFIPPCFALFGDFSLFYGYTVPTHRFNSPICSRQPCKASEWSYRTSQVQCRILDRILPLQRKLRKDGSYDGLSQTS
jgi:hypothetical protein